MEIGISDHIHKTVMIYLSESEKEGGLGSCRKRKRKQKWKEIYERTRKNQVVIGHVGVI